MTTEGLCQCGCGQATRVAHKTVRAKGWVKGRPLRYVNGHNANRRDRGTPLEQQHHEEDCGYTTACWVWHARRDEQGYGRTITRNGTSLAYRVIYERTVGPVPAGLELDHLCRNRACVNPAHLEPVTCAENVRRGANAKLTHEQVAEIRRLLSHGLTQVTIANRYGISQPHVSSIKLGKAWADQM